MREAQTSKAYRLIVDFEFGIDGTRQGLTPAELRRAWQARYGGAVSARVYARLSEDLLVDLLPMRVCAVTGRRQRAYVTRARATQ